MFCILLFLTSQIFSSTWTVDTTGIEGDSLQFAIIAASIDPGIDSVLVMNGTYHVAINGDSGLFIKSNVVLQSSGGATACTLIAISEDNLDTAYHVITQENEYVDDFVIEGFTITKGYARNSDDKGGGIFLYQICTGSSNYGIIRDNIITENISSNDGGGIYISDGDTTFTITNNVIEGNTSTNGKGGGICIFSNSSATIINNSIINNFADDGGGICISGNSCAPVIKNNLINCNTTVGDGGGILIYCSYNTDLTPQIIENEIMNDSAKYGGGIYIYSAYSSNISPLIRGNRIIGNYTTLYGAGIYAYIYPENSLCYPVIICDTIKYNYANGESGGIHWVGGDHAIIDSCIIVGNMADTASDRAGGGLSICATDLTFSHSLVDSNIAKYGGGIYLSFGGSPTLDDITVTNNHSSYIGGGLCVGVTDNPIIKNSLIHNNSSTTNAGGIYINNSHLLLDSNLITYNTSDKGGGISIYRAFPTIRNNTIANNASTIRYGGGIYLFQTGNCTIENNDIIFNNSNDDGGGLYLESCSLITVSFNNISNNIAADGGGGIQAVFSPIDLQYNVFSYNEAYVGGGLYINSCSPGIFNMEGNIISYNSANEVGGIYNWWSDISLRNNTIYNNHASTGSGSALYNDLHGSSIINHCVFGNNTNAFDQYAIYAGGDSVYIDSSFIVDNAGLVQIPSSGGEFSIYKSNIYFNTSQPDIEIYNSSTSVIPLTNNFWWDTTEVSISEKIYGTNNHTPWENDFISGIPGEPLSVDSIIIYDDSTYSNSVDSIDEPGTLYLRVYGEDRSPDIHEAAVVIVKSNIYIDGIAVALIENDTNSGIYQGELYLLESTVNDSVRLDDIYQLIKVDSTSDLIMVYANTDTSIKYNVVYKFFVNVEEQQLPQLPTIFSFSQNLPNPFYEHTVINYQLPEEVMVNINVYDISGRKVCALFNGIQNPGYYNIIWNGYDNNGEKLESGVYFYNITAGEYYSIKKAILLK